MRPGQIVVVPPDTPIREWKSGGKRDTDENKLDYEGFFNPLVIKKFAQYMHIHRKMSNGSYRDSDNWQNGFGDYEEHEKTCVKSLFRHFMDAWCIHRGDPTVTACLEDALCGVMFNAMAWLMKVLEKNIEEKNNGKN